MASNVTRPVRNASAASRCSAIAATMSDWSASPVPAGPNQSPAASMTPSIVMFSVTIRSRMRHGTGPRLATHRGVSAILRPVSAHPRQIALSAVLDGLSYALDLTEGEPPGHASRSCVIGMRIAEEIRLDAGTRSNLFYSLLL